MPGEATFTQADLDRIAATTRAEAAASASRKIAESLGMTPEEAAAKLAKLAELETAGQSETQRLTQEAATAKAEAARVAAELAAERQASAARGILRGAGVPLGQEAHVVRLLDLDSATPVADQVKALQSSLPGLFAPAQSTGTASNSAPVAGVPSADKTQSQQQTATPAERAAARLAALKL